MKLLTRIFCRHEQLKFVRNLYGDLINYSGGYRSRWECEACGKPFRRREIFALTDDAGAEKFLMPRTAMVFSKEQKNARRLATAFYLAASVCGAFTASPAWLVFSAVAFLLAANSYVILWQMNNLRILERE